MKNHKLILVMGLAAFLALAACQKNTVAPVVQKVVAKAEPDLTITLPKDSVMLTGTDGNLADVPVGYLWSQISGPSEASIVNESSASATARHLVEGKYLFQFMVIDNNGLSGVDTVGVTVKGATIITLDLSPANNPNETNVGIYNGQDASNHTSIEEPLCAWTINSIPITVRNLLKFDLSSIPTNATITSAQLYLYSDTIPKNGDLIHANSGIDNSFVVQQVATDWSTASVTWFNQPAGLTANQVILPSTTQPFLNMNINVKDMVSSMVSSNANYGFKLFVQQEVLYTCRIFCSSYYSDPSRHPRLIVKYIKH